MKKLLSLVILPFLLVIVGVPVVCAKDNALPAKVEGVTPKATGEDVLPNVPLTANMLYLLLSSEISAQRGNWQNAYMVNFELAKKTKDYRLAQRATEIALKAGANQDAFNATRLWVALAPNSEDAARFYLGLILYSADLSAAQPILAQKLKTAPVKERAIMMYQIQRLLSSLPKKAEAFALLDALLAPYNDMYESHVALSQAALANGNRHRAMSEADKALVLAPESTLALLVWAKASEDKKAVVEKLATFLQAQPQTHNVRLIFARTLIQIDQFSRARQEFKILLKAGYEKPLVLQALALIALNANETKLAKSYFEQYVVLMEKTEETKKEARLTMLRLADVESKEGNLEKAMAWLDKIVAIPVRDKTYAAAQLHRAQLFESKGDLPRALQVLDEAISSEKDDNHKQELILAKSMLLRKAGRNAESYATLTAGVEAFPESVRLLYDYGLQAERQGDVDVMTSAMRKVITLDPQYFHAYNALGYTLLERGGSLSEAKMLIEKAVEMAPNNPYVLDSMGWLYFKLGQLPEAELWLRRAYAKRKETEIAAHLGEVLWVRGKKEEAKAIWKKALEKAADSAVLQETFKRLNVTF